MKVHYVLDCPFDSELQKFIRACIKHGRALRAYVSPHIADDGTEHVHVVVVYPRCSTVRIVWCGYSVIFESELRGCSIQDYLSFSHGRKQPFL